MSKILIACEESQAITKEFRLLGHNAFSCDLLNCSGGHPEWHFKDDVLNVIKNNKFELMIAHPPCTYLSNAGAWSMYNKNGTVSPEHLRTLRSRTFTGMAKAIASQWSEFLNSEYLK